ncbi:MAG: hypothetical protein Q4G58_17240 [bacterium]|nr:hypothetical protein [bacterium]
MFRQIKILTKLSLCNQGNFNVIFHSKDKSQRNKYIGLAATYAVLILMFLFYSISLAIGLAVVHMEDLIPAYAFALISIIIFFFSIFKAGSIIFDLKSYELQIALPVSPAAIVISRFLSMYVIDLVLSLIATLPSLVVYAVVVTPGVSFYFMGIIGLLLVPLLPMTVASIIGAVIFAISARMKHKNLVTVLLTIVLVLGILLGEAALGNNSTIITQQGFTQISDMISNQLRQIYPPVAFYSDALVKGSVIDFLIFTLGSIGIFGLFVMVVQRSYVSICSALKARSSRRDYKMQSLKTGTMRSALLKKEMKRYFASSIYVSNTVIGYVLMVAGAIAIAIKGADEVEQLLEMPGVVSKALPFALAIMASIVSTTSCSISLEGRQWWITKSLPIRTKDVFDSKILWNLAVAGPFFLITELVLLFGIKTDLLGHLWLILIPAIYIVFMAVAGLTINLQFPNFTWENETVAVKQSAAVLVTSIVGIASCGIPLALVFVLGKEMTNVLMAVVSIVIMGITLILYKRNNRQDLQEIG